MNPSEECEERLKRFGEWWGYRRPSPERPPPGFPPSEEQLKAMAEKQELFDLFYLGYLLGRGHGIESLMERTDVYETNHQKEDNQKSDTQKERSQETNYSQKR